MFAMLMTTFAYTFTTCYLGSSNLKIYERDPERFKMYCLDKLQNSPSEGVIKGPNTVVQTL